MDVPTLGAAARLQSVDDFLEQVVRAVWLGTLTAIFLLCMLVALRRFEGQFRQPLSPSALIAVGLLGTVAVGALRVTWPHPMDDPPGAKEIAQRLLAPSFCLLLLAISISLPASSQAALAVLWTMIIGAEVGWWYIGLRGRANFAGGMIARLQRIRMRRAIALPAAFQRLGQHPPAGVEVSDEEEEDLETLPAEVTQQLTRVRVGSDGEVIFGLVRAEFEVGERSQNVHLSFCPPLEGTPAMTVQQVAGPSVAIKTAVAESYAHASS